MPTIVSRARGLAFLHIPKNAGTTVGEQLQAALPEDVVKLDHSASPEVGEFFADHPTLWQIEILAPDILQALGEADTIAIIREPNDRFRSALAEFIRTETGADPHKLEESDYNRLVDGVIQTITASRRWPRAYNFFRPQRDYVELDGRRYANSLFPMHDLGRLGQHVQDTYGIAIDLDQHARQTWTYGGGTKRLLSLVVPAAKRIVPARLYSSIKARLKPMVAQPGNSLLEGIFQRPDVTEFVADFYKGDFALYKELLERE